MSVTVGYDCIAVNISKCPSGAQLAGYTTGGGDIEWTQSDWNAHPGALRICQDAGASDHSADYLDVERYAATNAVAAEWYKAAYANYKAAARPGQRCPGFYTSMDNVTPLVNALIAGGVTSGPKLIVADWNDTQAQALLAVANASGPFPIVGVQWASEASYDIDTWSTAWLTDVSKVAPKPPTPKLNRHTMTGDQTFGEVAQSRDANAEELFLRGPDGDWTSGDWDWVLNVWKPEAGFPYYTENP
jgi:hypothetical protein